MGAGVPGRLNFVCVGFYPCHLAALQSSLTASQKASQMKREDKSALNKLLSAFLGNDDDDDVVRDKMKIILLT